MNYKDAILLLVILTLLAIFICWIGGVQFFTPAMSTVIGFVWLFYFAYIMTAGIHK